MEAVDFFSENATAFSDSYKTNPFFKERYQIWTGLIDRYGTSGGRAIDVGCGSGILGSHAAQKMQSVLGIDGSEEMLKLAAANAANAGIGNIEFARVRLSEIPTAVKGQFDLLMCSSVLEYSDDLERDVSSICNLVRPGGALIVSMPNALCFYRTLERISFALTGSPKNVGYIKHVVTPGAFKRMLKARGIEILETHFYRSAFGLSHDRNLLRPRALFNNLFAVAGRKAK